MRMYVSTVVAYVCMHRSSPSCVSGSLAMLHIRCSLPCLRWQLVRDTTAMNTTQWVRDTPRVDLAPDVSGPILTVQGHV